MLKSKVVLLLAVVFIIGCGSDVEKAEGHYKTGVLYGKNEDYESAVKEIEKAISLDNTRVEFYYNLGVTYTYIDETSIKGEEAYIKAVSMLVAGDKSDKKKYLASSYYNLACIYALRGGSDKALKSIESSVDAGFKNYHMIVRDKDLQSLKDMDKFKELLIKMRGA